MSMKRSTSRWRALSLAAGASLLLAASVGGASAEASSTAEHTQARSQAAALTPGCWGDYCSGKFANETGCDKDAQTLEAAPLVVDRQKASQSYGGSVGITPAPEVGVIPTLELSANITLAPYEVVIGAVQLRWSPTCRTKWARLVVIGQDAQGSDLVAEQDGADPSTHYKQTWKLHPGGVWRTLPENVYFTPMIYSPNRGVRAQLKADKGFYSQEPSTQWR